MVWGSGYSILQFRAAKVIGTCVARILKPDTSGPQSYYYCRPTLITCEDVIAVGPHHPTTSRYLSTLAAGIEMNCMLSGVELYT